MKTQALPPVSPMDRGPWKLVCSRGDYAEYRRPLGPLVARVSIGLLLDDRAILWIGNTETTQRIISWGYPQDDMLPPDPDAVLAWASKTLRAFAADIVNDVAPDMLPAPVVTETKLTVGTDKVAAEEAYRRVREAWETSGLHKGIGRHRPSSGQNWANVHSGKPGHVGNIEWLLKDYSADQLVGSALKYAEALRNDPGDTQILMASTFFSKPTKTKMPRCIDYIPDPGEQVAEQRTKDSLTQLREAGLI